MFIYTVFLKEYLESTTIVTHMKSFTSYPPAEAYVQELQNSSYDCDTDVCVVMNDLY